MQDLSDVVGPLTTLRRDIHAHPELGFAEFRTAMRIAQVLGDAGLAVHEGIGGTGVVGVLRVGDGTRSVGLRADMDALPFDVGPVCPGPAARRAAFTVAAMMAMSRCCWVQRKPWRGRGIFQAPSISSFSRPKKARAARGR